MKEEILALIEKEEGVFVLNNISFLNRWTKSGTGKTVDELTVDFTTMNGVDFVYSSKEIVSRDYDGIINEVIIATQEYLQEVSNELCKNLKNGYRNKTHI